MSSKRFRLPTAVFGVLVKDDKILLCRRFNTGHEDGNYGLPAGHIEGGETLTTALIRELKEEIDIMVEPKEMMPVLFVHRHSPDTEYIDAFFKINYWTGTPRIAEEDKCDGIDWFPKDQLPKNIIGYVRLALEAIDRGETYLETGWK